MEYPQLENRQTHFFCQQCTFEPREWSLLYEQKILLAHFWQTTLSTFCWYIKTLQRYARPKYVGPRAYIFGSLGKGKGTLLFEVPKPRDGRFTTSVGYISFGIFPATTPGMDGRMIFCVVHTRPPLSNGKLL